eukprot:4615002-Prymnesium_polylepis.1
MARLPHSQPIGTGSSSPSACASASATARAAMRGGGTTTIGSAPYVGPSRAWSLIADGRVPWRGGRPSAQ